MTQIHRDTANLGPSAIVTFGSFVGGEVLMWPDDDGRNLSDLESSLHPVKVDARQPCFFDGNKAHATKQFCGERFSLVFFCVHGAGKASRRLRSSLEAEGAIWPEFQ